MRKIQEAAITARLTPRVPVAAAALGALLILSLIGKFTAQSGTLLPDSARLAADIAARLEAGGYHTETRPSHFGKVVSATRGACRLAVRPTQPSGETDSAVARDLAGTGRIRFAWRGTLSATPPRWRAMAEFYLAREQARLGLNTNGAPLLAVADNGRCDETMLRFDGIRTHSRFVAPVIR